MPRLDDLAHHVRSFAKIMTLRTGLLELEDWLAGAEASDLPQLRSFARGIRRDQQAVTAGLSLPYSAEEPFLATAVRNTWHADQAQRHREYLMTAVLPAPPFPANPVQACRDPLRRAHTHGS